MPDGTFGAAPEPETADPANSSSKRREREVSTIGFPYQTLEDAIETARAILDKGAVAMSRDQLAGAVGLSAGSGNFTTKVGAARMFGLIETVAGKYQLTRLGFDILDSDDARERAAKVRAFLGVPLYRRTYEEFRNGQLPPRPHGLENAFVSFGVAPKQKERARRAFDNSARMAGFFEHGNDKLVEPVLIPVGDRHYPSREEVNNDRVQSEQPAPPRTRHPDTVTTVPPAAEHPFIKGLLLSLPGLGDDWNAEDRVKWLRTAADAFELMYRNGKPITIAPTEAVSVRSRKRQPSE